MSTTVHGLIESDKVGLIILDDYAWQLLTSS